MAGCPAYAGGMTTLDGKVVLVVGASGGLGSRFAERLAAEGATVVRAGRDPQRMSGENAYLADIRDPSGPASLVQAALLAHGRLDGVIVAAGVVAFGPVDQLTDAALAELFETNAYGAIRLVRDAMPALADSATAGNEPFVVTLSGVVSESPTFGLAAYSASKAALAAFTQAATRDLRKAGIRVLDARPGHVETELSRHPIEGASPKFPTGLDPDAVVDRILTAIVDDEKDLPSTSF